MSSSWSGKVNMWVSNFAAEVFPTMNQIILEGLQEFQHDRACIGRRGMKVALPTGALGRQNAGR